MNYRVIDEYEDWHKARQKGIGGSDAAAIAGLSQWGGPMAVYLEKIGEAPRKKDNETTRQGRDLEDYVVRRFEEKAGLKVRQEKRILQHPTIDFMIGNIDRWVEEDGEDVILECKTTSGQHGKFNKDSSIPEYIELQCHHYLAITGAKKCYLAVVVFQKDFFIHEIERDEEIIQNLIKIESDFWNNHVIPRKMPPPDGLEVTSELIKQMFPNAQENQTVILDGYGEKLSRFLELKSLLSTLKKEKDQIEQDVQMQLKEAGRGDAGKYEVLWPTINKKGHTVKPSTYRKFTVKEVA